MRRRRGFSESFKRKVVAEINSGTNTWAHVMRKYQLESSTICRWRRQLNKDFEGPRTDGERQLEAEIGKLERKIGQLVIENELLKKVLNLIRRHSKSDTPLSPNTKDDSQSKDSASLPE